MTRAEAEEEARRLQAEHPERATHQWFPKEEGAAGWVVVRIQAPPGTRIDPLTAEIRADEKPPTPDDPRTSYSRNVGSDWVA